ncbi:MAG: hypothetical protein DMF21_00980 [Verrucomicrobia bacterium]|nr:MAG: hypothetical protein DMF21_00980 [Verrucomicrobiota bacterium]PYS57778.1 MAG: hypothetical protein DMF74_25170 [Acidobacteriota bacterium]
MNLRESWLRVFFALAACSWMPHWSCHYYRLETGSSFVVGTWDFSSYDSVVALSIYSILIGANLVAVVRLQMRLPAAISSGLLHLAIGALHVYRLVFPFRFEVFGYTWSQQASLREAIIVIPFGVLCLWIARHK